MWEDGDGIYTLAGVKAFWKAKGITSIQNPHYCLEINPIKDVCVASMVKSYVWRHRYGLIGDL